MDRDLFNLYQRVELPLMHVLDSMRRVGIGIDGDRAHAELQQLRQELDSLTQRITEGVPVDLSSNQEVFRFLVQKGVRFNNPYVYTAQKVSTPVLEELALAYPGVQAILDWRQMHQDVAFLSMAAGQATGSSCVGPDSFRYFPHLRQTACSAECEPSLAVSLRACPRSRTHQGRLFSSATPHSGSSVQ